MSGIADQLAHSADLAPAEIGAYLQALHEAGLVSSGELGAETTSEAIAWAILALLSNPDPRRAAERARDVAFFRNFRLSDQLFRICFNALFPRLGGRLYSCFTLAATTPA
jgi:hypothetical protein